MEKESELIHNEQWHRFEMHIDDKTAFIEYTKEGNTYLLMHTEVPPELEGHGLAKSLVEKTFDWLEKKGAKMTPYCPYIFTYIKRHPEWKRIEVPKEEME